MKTTYQILAERAINDPSHPLFRYRDDEGWHTITTREGVEWAACVAGGLAGHGIQQGDRVAVLAENRWEWLLVCLALRHLGAVTVGLYPTDSQAHWKEILQNCQARALFVSGNLVANYAPIHEETGVSLVVGFDGPSSLVPNTKSFEELLHARPIPAADYHRDDIATLIYTSGTTGKPKGAMLTHDNQSSNAQGADDYFAIGPTDHYLSFLPLSHAFERTATNSMMRAGACVYFGRGLSNLVEDRGEVEPSIVCTVPRVIEKVYDKVMEGVGSSNILTQKLFHHALAHNRRCFAREQDGRSVPLNAQLLREVYRGLVFKKIRNLFGSRLRYIVSGGAPLAPAIAEFFFSVGIPCYEGYGITECAPIVAANHEGKVRLGTVGDLFPGVEVKIASDGEILVRGPSVMAGYWENEESTREVIDREGWFRTGDLGRLDGDGFLSIHDRKKEILITAGGKNISPNRIEQQAEKSPYISQICAIANRRRFVSALIVPDFEAIEARFRRHGQTPPPRAEMPLRESVLELIQREVDRVNEHLARYETIRRFILLTEEFSVENELLTPTLKMRRKYIEKRYLPQIDALYGESAPASENPPAPPAKDDEREDDKLGVALQ